LESPENGYVIHECISLIGVIDVQRLDAPVNIEQPSKRSRFEDVKVVLRNACIYANKG
ncbi:hypothetical protein AAVH_40669, partial [Aphelenchoides avenae]